MGVALLIAVAAGHLVQNPGILNLGGSAGLRISAADTSIAAPVLSFSQVRPLSADTRTAQVTEVAEIQMPPSPKEVQTLPAVETDPAALARRIEQMDAEKAVVGALDEGLNHYGLPCDTALSLRAADAGLVHLSLTAPCNPDERVEIIHDRLIFAAQTANDGGLEIDVPALDPAATILLRFADGSVLHQTISVPEALEYERVVLQWNGDSTIGLHAYEFGATYFDDGHVYADHPRTPMTGRLGKGGFMTALGAQAVPMPMLAEVYSYPRGESAPSNTVRVSVEVEITQDNCARDIAAETIQRGGDGKLHQAALTMSLPDCDAIGEFLVLKNAVRDLKIASN